MLGQDAVTPRDRNAAMAPIVEGFASEARKLLGISLEGGEG